MVSDGSGNFAGGSASIPGASQQVSSDATQYQHENNRPRLARGLMPTDGHTDAYKRSQNRASRRARSERTSYLVATGHLDPEETEQLTKHSMADLVSNTTQYSDLPVKNNNLAHINNISDYTNQRSPSSTRNASKRSNFEPSFLDDLNRTLANGTPPIATTNPQLQQSYELQQQENSKPKRKDSRRKYKKEMSLYNSNRIGNKHGMNGDGDDIDRGRFRQTYTEVTLPMKTSPAFEYILKDDERRNKRCCLWFLYSTLLTICIAIIVFCSVCLVLRSQSRLL